MKRNTISGANAEQKKFRITLGHLPHHQTKNKAPPFPSEPPKTHSHTPHNYYTNPGPPEIMVVNDELKIFFEMFWKNENFEGPPH